MNVVIQINVRDAIRDAIPVRAIPFLTNWKTMTPDAVAQALAGDEHFYIFHGLSAFYIEDSKVKQISSTWWESFACRQLAALNAGLKRKEGEGTFTWDEGYQQWQRDALQILPAGFFVWKDEFEPLHEKRYGVGGRIYLRADGMRIPKDEHANMVLLNFEPPIPDKETQRLVLEGLEPDKVATQFTFAPVQTNRARKPLDEAGEDNLFITEQYAALLDEMMLCPDPLAKVDQLLRPETPESIPEPTPAPAQTAGTPGAVPVAPEPPATPQPEPQTATPATAPEEPITPAKAVPAQTAGTPALDQDMLATPKALIAAFGSFTGMTGAWFDHIDDTPGLKAARRYAGTGGRRYEVPLLDPYKVMLWLVNPKRKKGTPISEQTAWRMFKMHFSKSYEVHAIGDPNEDSSG